MNKSLNELSMEIFDKKTSVYFKEVLSSYLNRNFRASIVGLYSVMICDIVFKLQYLRDVYNDSVAKDILDEIEQLQSDNPRSPDWENKLVDLVFERTNIIDTILKTNIDYLQKHRHLCAHPVLTSDSLLYEPSQSVAEGHIDSILQHLLCKSPIFGKNIFVHLLTDLEDKKELLPQRKDLEKYVQKAYIDKCNANMLKYIFRNLWKICFRVESEEAKENRVINVRALEVFYESKKTILFDEIKNDNGYYSNFKSGKPTELLCEFLSKHNEVFNELTGDAQTVLVNFSEANERYKIVSRFIFNSDNEQIEKIKQFYDEAVSEVYEDDLNYTAVSIVVERLKQKGMIEEVTDLCIYLYINSKSYHKADKIFRILIKPFFSAFSEDQVKVLLDGIKENSQTYQRNEAKGDHLFINDRIKVKFPEIALDEYETYLIR